VRPRGAQPCSASRRSGRMRVDFALARRPAWSESRLVATLSRASARAPLQKPLRESPDVCVATLPPPQPHGQGGGSALSSACSPHDPPPSLLRGDVAAVQLADRDAPDDEEASVRDDARGEVDPLAL